MSTKAERKAASKAAADAKRAAALAAGEPVTDVVDEPEQDDDAVDDPATGDSEPGQDGLAADPAAPVEPVKVAAPVKAASPIDAVDESVKVYLDSPRGFGIWVNGKLRQFKKGRTPLTAEEAIACRADSYVKDNGAEVVTRK